MQKYKYSIILKILLLAISFSIQAQGVKELNVEGVRVYFKPSSKKVINARLFFVGGTANYAKEKEGIESMALNMVANAGTTEKDKVAFNTAAEQIGAEIGSSSTYDYSTLHLNCLKMYWEDSWSLFAEAIRKPAFDEEEFMLTKERFVNNARQHETNPDNHLRDIAMSNVFSGMDYAKRPGGSEANLANLQLVEVKNHYRNILQKNNVFLVVAGDLTEEDLRHKVAGLFDGIPTGEKKNMPEFQINIDENPFLEEKDLATNYLRGIMAAPKMNEREGLAMQLAMSILNDRFFLELRTKRSLSYAPAAFYSSGVIQSPYNVLYISTEKPKESMEVMVETIEEVRKNGFTEKELKDVKQVFITQHYLGLETNSSQTMALGLAILADNMEIQENFTEIVQKVDLEFLNQTFRQYTDKIDWTYLGKREMVSMSDFVQPES